MSRELTPLEMLEDAETLARLAAAAGEAAYRRALDAGIPVTVVENGWVVRHHPDGRRERVRQVGIRSSDAG